LHIDYCYLSKFPTLLNLSFDGRLPANEVVLEEPAVLAIGPVEDSSVVMAKNKDIM
jgi:hypothetical protein